jgi:hypothetical protein
MKPTYRLREVKRIVAVRKPTIRVRLLHLGVAVRGIELSGEDGSGRGRQRGFVCHDWLSKDEMTRWITELRSDCQSKSISHFVLPAKAPMRSTC